MNFFNKARKAIRESEGHSVLIKETGKIYKYGENPYYDEVISNCLMCDMFPEEVKNANDFYKFNRSEYVLT